MRTRPPEVDPARIASALTEGWGLRDVELEYLPVGAGSYHWRAAGPTSESWFVTLDDLESKPFLGSAADEVFERLRGALETAATLRHEGGLEFVVAPLRAAGGEVLCRIGGRYAVAVYPYLGEAPPFRKKLGEAERTAFKLMLDRLHRVPATGTPHAQTLKPDFPWRDGLVASLDTMETGRAGALLQANADMIRGWLVRFDELVAELEANPATRVITHGEPHSGNIVYTGGRFMLVDWDTVGLAPAERDLWLVGGGDPQLCELYRLRWRLDDLSWAVHDLQAPGTGEQQAEGAWRGLRDTIEHEPFTG